MKKTIIAFVAGLLLLFACTKDETVQPIIQDGEVNESIVEAEVNRAMGLIASTMTLRNAADSLCCDSTRVVTERLRLEALFEGVDSIRVADRWLHHNAFGHAYTGLFKEYPKDPSRAIQQFNYLLAYIRIELAAGQLQAQINQLKQIEECENY